MKAGLDSRPSKAAPHNNAAAAEQVPQAAPAQQATLLEAALSELSTCRLQLSSRQAELDRQTAGLGAARADASAARSQLALVQKNLEQAQAGQPTDARTGRLQAAVEQAQQPQTMCTQQPSQAPAGDRPALGRPFRLEVAQQLYAVPQQAQHAHQAQQSVHSGTAGHAGHQTVLPGQLSMMRQGAPHASSASHAAISQQVVDPGVAAGQRLGMAKRLVKSQRAEKSQTNACLQAGDVKQTCCKFSHAELRQLETAVAAAQQQARLAEEGPANQVCPVCSSIQGRGLAVGGQA